uniref:Signal peptide peptidase A, Serine peptidase, MEROPS family S49 n=1 Tax=Chlorobium chlorochromatii (strain CaD3) TaxID=340177 RepID=Q3APX0_CHLCH
MNNSSIPQKRRGCFRPGCLWFLVVPLFIVVALFWAFRSSHDMPDRFVLVVPLSGKLAEVNNERSSLPFMPSQGDLSLQEVLFVLHEAAKDEQVSEVLLQLDGVEAAPAKIAEVRAAVADVRRKGKKVSAFLYRAEDSDYLLATAADTIIMQRGASLLLDGLKAESLFYTGTLNKLGITVQAAQWKEYKSGIEPFTRTSASKEYREQINMLLDDVYNNYLSAVSERRKISRSAFEAIINNEALLSAERAKALGLVDRIATFWDVERSMTKQLTGEELSSENNALVHAADYRNAMDYPQHSSTSDAIAVITMSGPIMRSVDNLDDGIDVATMQHSLEAALENKSVKAIVLRIDSPGGEAIASADILQMINAAATKKTLVVSMSGVAASGGYMVALGGKTIVAHPLTITGSIGVYALKPTIQGLAEKVGLQREVITRGRFADATSPFTPLEGEAYNKFVASAGDVYNDFISKVATSRRMKVTAVDSVAGGRVWTGSRAKQVGLVDRMGGLFDALALAKERAGISKDKEPTILLYPLQQGWLQSLLGGATLNSVTKAIATALLGNVLPINVEQQPLSAMQPFYDMLIRSGKPHMVALMPAEVVVK